VHRIASHRIDLPGHHQGRISSRPQALNLVMQAGNLQSLARQANPFNPFSQLLVIAVASHAIVILTLNVIAIVIVMLVPDRRTRTPRGRSGRLRRRRLFKGIGTLGGPLTGF
jgi:hypothetical protein